MQQFLSAKEIWRLTDIKPWRLKYYRLCGYLKNIQWSPGKGKPLYDLEEIKSVFHLNKAEKSV